MYTEDIKLLEERVNNAQVRFHLLDNERDSLQLLVAQVADAKADRQTLQHILNAIKEIDEAISISAKSISSTRDTLDFQRRVQGASQDEEGDRPNEA